MNANEHKAKAEVGGVAAFCVAMLMIFYSGAGAAGSTLLQSAEVAYVKGDFGTAWDLYGKALAEPGVDAKMAEGIRAKMAICQSNLEVNPAGTQPAVAAGPRKIHAKPQANEVRTLEIKELGNFEYDPDRGGGVPADVKALTGLHVKMTGYMIPLTQASDKITEFALVPSLLACCFGAPPQLQHTIMVHCGAKAPTAFYADLITVDGTLKVQEKREDNFTVSLFEVDAKSVGPAEVKTLLPVLSGK